MALVGAMGSGKTALVSLLPRLYEASTGSVRIDGADVREVDLASLRQAIALVTDDPFLFSATIHDNIAYARPDATREEVERAAEVAQADDFISELPKGYETLVGERGLTLSGGQRQRIAIARAVLADPRILVLDDATSSVDASTEQEIKPALGEVMAGRTTFVIAHRLSTIALADEIVVLEDGRVAAHGSHDELLEESDLYREIVEKGMPDQVFMTRNAVGAVGLWAVRHAPYAQGTRPGPQAARADRAARAVQVARARDVRVARGRHRRRPGAGSAGQGGDRQRDPAARRRRARSDRRGCSWCRRSCTRSPRTRRPTWSAGSASARSRTCASACSPTCSSCRSASTRATGPG